MRKFVELVLVVAGLFFLAYAVGAVKAETINLNYSECFAYNDSNGSATTFCAVAWQDLNITEPSDCRLNLTVISTAPYFYTNLPANISIYIAAPKYNIDTYLNYGANFTHNDTNISCSAPRFPALNTQLNITNNMTYSPLDTRYNFSVIANFEFNTSVCRDNIDRTLDYGGDYYSDKCNIHIRAPVFPTLNDTRMLQPGETAQNAQHAFSYICNDTTPQIMMCVATQVLQNETMRQWQINNTELQNQIGALNVTLEQQKSMLRDREENISVSTALLTANNIGSEWVDKLLMAFGIIVGTIAAVIYIQHWYTKKRGPPSGETEEPLMVEVARRTDEKLSKRFEELDKEHAQKIHELNEKFEKKSKADALRREAEKLDKELGG